MLWLQLILAGSLLRLIPSDGAPDATTITPKQPLARRVLIPTWELVVPVLPNSTPILEQNGPDSVVLMTEASKFPR